MPATFPTPDPPAPTPQPYATFNWWKGHVPTRRQCTCQVDGRLAKPVTIAYEELPSDSLDRLLECPVCKSQFSDFLEG